MSWETHNQAFLGASLRRLRLLLERHAEPSLPQVEEPPAVDAEGWPPWPEDAGAPPALRALCETFGLGPFERDVLLLCAGMELDARFPSLCARAQGEAQRPWPTFSLALAALPGAHWDALAPHGALRYWNLVTPGTGPTLAQAPLRADERIWQYLVGIDALDERLVRYVQDVSVSDTLVPSHEALARQVAATLAAASRERELPVLQLCGKSRLDQAAIAARAAELLEYEVQRLPAEGLPSSREEVERLARLWNREARLGTQALLLDCHDLESGDTERAAAVARLVATVQGPVMLAAPERRPTGARRTALFDIPLPRPLEQRELWLDALTRRLPAESVKDWELPEASRTLVGQFDLDRTSIESAVTQALGQLLLAEKPGPSQAREALWNSARAQSRSRLETLAQRLEVRATWEDLRLSDAQFQQLSEVEMHVRRRLLVHEDWGFSSGGWRGTGTTVLFSGPSGTGKTLAAEVLAHRLGLDLYRIDLSGVVSKYIGETEKNLRKVFDAAESGGAVLLFDEADALFGKRSEVKDSHDRYANLEVSYLLQRMESFHGLAILTTNLKAGLDAAFVRRLRFIVDFSFPDRKQREALWRRAFPAGTPTHGMDPARLAALNVSGAVIRSIALHAAFLAAEDASRGETPPGVRPRHVLAAARREFEKLQQPFPHLKEFEGWE
ncbi:ATP-binding protein [Vitiosangium sp. GDMCC 1.1324]|uniref:ATP-binding protein n=1 Tax=Vitiosangium sp. (strain GDMCC 1.1324) TaxID=2138576 RepID=UPI000D39FAE7|nr:ATP-binding protein [Vitiosangium sp. GDMCC 1.1324]PTL79516.1 ATPase [Vitiosangium sp. GDMCC 1.1324]